MENEVSYCKMNSRKSFSLDYLKLNNYTHLWYFSCPIVDCNDCINLKVQIGHIIRFEIKLALEIRSQLEEEVVRVAFRTFPNSRNAVTIVETDIYCNHFTDLNENWIVIHVVFRHLENVFSSFLCYVRGVDGWNVLHKQNIRPSQAHLASPLRCCNVLQCEIASKQEISKFSIIFFSTKYSHIRTADSKISE